MRPARWSFPRRHGWSDPGDLAVPPDVPEPEVADRPVGWSARLGSAGRTFRGTAAGLLNVLRMAWAASPALTVGLVVLTGILGLVPALTTHLARLLINAIAGGAALTGPIIVLVGLQFLVFAANAAAAGGYNVVGRLLEERVGLAVQTDIMDHASRLELGFFENSASYDLLRDAQQEAATRPAAMVANAFGQIQVVITFTSMIALLIDLSPVIALAALLGPVPAFLSDARFGRRTYRFARWSAPIRRRMQYLNGLVTADTAAKEIKLFGLGPRFVGHFRGLGEILYGRQRRLVVSRNLWYVGWSLITTLATSLAYLYVAWLAVNGRLAVGDLVLFISALTVVQGSVQNLFRGIASLYEDNLYLDRLATLFAVPTTMPGPANPLPLPDPVRGHVVFDNVSFSYPGSDVPALSNVSLEIRPGQTVAVVGRNGAGKSTLIKLLCRLYDPSRGRILLDGVDIRELDEDELRSVIGAMFQDYVEYQATAAENIGLGNVAELHDRARVVDSARRAGADELIEGLPRGYDTQLGKWFGRGVELSGGEWQKIALSRAFMRDARILVLDEPTSALDAAAEHELFGRLRRLARGRSTIYVSHRFSTVRRADRVLLLSGGRVAEDGTHEELMAEGGEYAHLFGLQALAYVDGVDPLARQGGG